MKRNEMLAKLEDTKIWDIIIIGGGATGTGIAVDAASRGYKTLLLEKNDFSSGTSSRSTKLIHGGVRYLQQGNISLVMEALKERGILRRNAPHLVKNLKFIVPVYDWWEGPFYGIGLKLYDMLAGKEGLGDSERISKEETIRLIPNIEQSGLRGGVIYYDGQFDDSRLVVNLVRTAAEQSAVLLNYFPVNAFIKESGFLKGVAAIDKESSKEYIIKGKVIINAGGPFSDLIRQLDEPDCRNLIKPSQGTHIVLDGSFLSGSDAIMVPHTDDGRLFFAIPWHNNVLVGTTDTNLKGDIFSPIPDSCEIDFLLNHAARYLDKDPQKIDIKSVFAGVRPLVTDPNEEKTAEISREHIVTISHSGLISIAGGKWTTYRKMAEEVLEKAIMIGELEKTKCTTENLQLHGFHNHSEIFRHHSFYGSDAIEIENFSNSMKTDDELLSSEFNLYASELLWSIRNEMIVNIDDFLARRRRILFLNVFEADKMAERIAEIMKNELNQTEDWKNEQIKNYFIMSKKFQVINSDC